MSRFVLSFLILSLLKNDVKCETFGKLTESQESLMPRTKDDLPKSSSHLNSSLFSLHELFLNSSKLKEAFSKNITSRRAAKFFIPKFELLAGLNLGGGLSHSNMASLANLAKISGSPSLSPPSGLLNPFVAASYDPYPYVTASYSVQQSINDLTSLLHLIKSQLETGIKSQNHSAPSNTEPLDKFMNDEQNEVDFVDDRKRRKDKTKIKNKIKKKKRQDIELQEDDENEVVEDVPIEPVRRQSQRPVATTTSPPTADVPETEVTTIAPNRTEIRNNTQSDVTGYYGGRPQGIGNVQITYDLPQETYGPAFSGPGSSIWASSFPGAFGGSSWQSPGFPSGSYGSPSLAYGLPSPSYGQSLVTSGSYAPSYIPSPQNPSGFPSSYNPPHPQTSGSIPSSYGPPLQNSPPGSQSYGPPSQFYGVPTQTPASETPTIPQPTGFPTQTRNVVDIPQFSNPSSNFNGELQNFAYTQFPPYFDSVSADDLASGSFPSSSRSWLSNLPLGRSRNLPNEAKFTSHVKSVNGFLPN